MKCGWNCSQCSFFVDFLEDGNVIHSNKLQQGWFYLVFYLLNSVSAVVDHANKVLPVRPTIDFFQMPFLLLCPRPLSGGLRRKSSDVFVDNFCLDKTMINASIKWTLRVVLYIRLRYIYCLMALVWGLWPLIYRIPTSPTFGTFYRSNISIPTESGASLYSTKSETNNIQKEIFLLPFVDWERYDMIALFTIIWYWFDLRAVIWNHKTNLYCRKYIL